jgi:hypothetical protein
MSVAPEGAASSSIEKPERSSHSRAGTHTVLIGGPGVFFFFLFFFKRQFAGSSLLIIGSRVLLMGGHLGHAALPEPRLDLDCHFQLRARGGSRRGRIG